jgi:hypothetical protein
MALTRLFSWDFGKIPQVLLLWPGFRVSVPLLNPRRLSELGDFTNDDNRWVGGTVGQVRVEEG